MKIRVCSFCGNRSPTLLDQPGNKYDYRHAYYVHCDECMTDSKPAGSFDEAINYWNRGHYSAVNLKGVNR